MISFAKCQFQSWTNFSFITQECNKNSWISVLDANDEVFILMWQQQIKQKMCPEGGQKCCKWQITTPYKIWSHFTNLRFDFESSNSICALCNEHWMSAMNPYTTFMKGGLDGRKCKEHPRVPWERTHSEPRKEPPFDGSGWLLGLWNFWKEKLTHKNSART